MLKKEKLDKRDIGLIVEKITVFENHLNVRLKSDVDELLSLEDTEHTVNFKSGSKDIAVTQKSAKRADKVFTVNVIREGDPLEIFTGGDGNVIFKKYSPIGELSKLSEDYAESIAGGTELAVLICDKDNCIAAAGISKREVIERRISPELEELLEHRKPYIYSGAGVGFFPLEGVDKSAAVAVPVISAGDIIGAGCLMNGKMSPDRPKATLRLPKLPPPFSESSLKRNLKDGAMQRIFRTAPF